MKIVQALCFCLLMFIVHSKPKNKEDNELLQNLAFTPDSDFNQNNRFEYGDEEFIQVGLIREVESNYDMTYEDLKWLKPLLRRTRPDVEI